jgi:ABC-type nitrate/sulfonate/bicarbonate transport system ATPase subunit
MAGLLGPSRGAISVGGAPAAEQTTKPVLMFQRPALLPWLSARDNVLLPLHFSKALRRDRAAARAKADRLIAQVGLADRAPGPARAAISMGPKPPAASVKPSSSPSSRRRPSTS